MKIAFWNTQRNPGLSGFNLAWPRANFQIACEVLGNSQLKVNRQNSRRSQAQLGYRVVMPFSNASLEAWDVDNYDRLTGFTIGHKGGNSFVDQSKRQLAHLTVTAPARLDANIFVFHANSSNKAATVTSWVVCELVRNLADFVLLGDFNCNPDDLVKAITYIYRETDDDDLKDDLKGVRVTFAGPTHNAKALGGATTTLDYMVSKTTKMVLSVDNSTQDADHHPIVADDNMGVLAFDGMHEVDFEAQFRNWRWSARWRRVYNSNGCEVWELIG